MNGSENKTVPPPAQGTQETDGSGRPNAPESVLSLAKAQAARVGRELVRQFSSLTPRELRQVLTAVRAELIPRRKPGKRPDAEISAAFADWSTGMRRTAFYEKHIRNYPGLSKWRPVYEERRLVEAMRTRARRSRRTGSDDQS
jgi:hypothetical protein